MEDYILIYYIKSKYTGYLKRYAKYFDNLEDIIEFIDKDYEKFVSYTVYYKMSVAECMKKLKS